MSRKTTIPIYDGDDFERLAELRRAVDIAERNAADASPLRLGDEVSSDVQDAKDAYDKFVDEAAERAEEWEIHPIGHEEFRELLKEHPPRKITGEDGKESDHPDDAIVGVNSETFGKALLLFVDPEDDDIRTIVKPVFDSQAALRKRLKRLSAGEFDSIWVAAFFLNNGAVSDPKLSRFSPAGPRSSET
jgi:hypothetical protein